MTDAENNQKKRVLMFASRRYIEHFGPYGQGSVMVESVIGKGTDASYEHLQTTARMLIQMVDVKDLCYEGRQLLRSVCEAAGVPYISPRLSMNIRVKGVEISGDPKASDYHVVVTSTKDGTVLYDGEPYSVRE